MPKSVRERLKESETRNKTLVEYIDIIEAQCAGVLRISSEQYDRMNMIFTPGSKQAKSVFADICRAMVPIVQDVEDMKLSPEMVKAVLGRGGMMIHQEGKKADDEELSKDICEYRGPCGNCHFPEGKEVECCLENCEKPKQNAAKENE